MTITALPAADRPRLVQILTQMDADEEGVVLAAALAAKRLLAKHGQRWVDIAPSLFTSPPPPAESWRDLVNRCIEHVDALNAWEAGFLLDLRAFSEISPKQQRRLDIIAEKALRAGGRR